MPYGWITDVGTGVQQDIRARQPIINLQVNRGILDREAQEARRRADERMRQLVTAPVQQQAVLEAPPTAAPATPVAQPETAGALPMVTALPSPQENEEARQAWAAFGAKKQRDIAALTAKANEGAIPLEELLAAQKSFDDEAAAVTARYGTAPTGSMSGAKAALDELVKMGGKGGKIRISDRLYHDTPLLTQAQGYLGERFEDATNKDYMRQLILSDEMAQARQRAIPELQGDEGLAEFDKNLEASRAGLNQLITQSGLNQRAATTAATTLEKQRMIGVANTLAAEMRQEAKDRYDEASLALKNRKLDIDQGELDLATRDGFRGELNRFVKSAEKTVSDANRRMASMGSLYRDSMTGALTEAGVEIAREKTKASYVKSLAIKLSAMSFGTPEQYAAAVNAMYGLAGTDAINFDYSSLGQPDDPSFAQKAMSLFGGAVTPVYPNAFESKTREAQVSVKEGEIAPSTKPVRASTRSVSASSSSSSAAPAKQSGRAFSFKK